MLSGHKLLKGHPFGHQRRIAALSLCAAVYASTNADIDRFRAVVEANPPIDVVCSYTTVARTSENPDETRIERFSVANGPELLAINGEAPSPEALAEYEKERAGRQGPQRGPEMDFADLVNAGSVTIADEDDETVTFGFTPKNDDAQSAELLANLVGTLTVAKPNYRPVRLEMVLQNPVSPAPTVKVHEFRQEMTFTRDAATNATLVESMSFAMRGKAFVFRKIANEGRIDFKDFDCEMAAPDAEVPSVD